MKDIRNTIVYKYIEDNLVEVFDKLMIYTPKLLLVMSNTVQYASEKNNFGKI